MIDLQASVITLSRAFCELDTKRSRVVQQGLLKTSMKMELGQSTGLISECKLFQICVK